MDYTVFICGLKWMEVDIARRRSTGVCPLKPEVEHMFLGQYHHSLDEKGRMTIPASFRELLEDGVYLTQGFDRNIKLLTESAFMEMAGKVNKLSETDPKIRKLRRLVFSNAGKVEVDRLGRVLIPNYLRDFAKLEGEAVIVGVGEAIEIWSPEAWQGQVDELSDSDANAQQFAEHDL